MHYLTQCTLQLLLNFVAVYNSSHHRPSDLPYQLKVTVTMSNAFADHDGN